MAYTISISGQGGIFGVAKLTKEQFNFWEQNLDYLSDAISRAEEFDDIEVPENARIDQQFYDLCDEWGASGIFEDDLYIVVENEDSERVIESSLSDYVSEYDPDDENKIISFSRNSYDLPSENSGCHYIFWQNLQNDVFWRAELEINEFDPLKLKFIMSSIEDNGDVVVKVEYEGVELDSFEYELSFYVTATLHAT